MEDIKSCHRCTSFDECQDSESTAVIHADDQIVIEYLEEDEDEEAEEDEDDEEAEEDGNESLYEDILEDILNRNHEEDEEEDADNEDEEWEDGSIASQFSELEMPTSDFIFHFGDVHHTFDLIVSEDSDFYDYVMSDDFINECCGAPVYYLFKFYRHIGSFDQSLFLDTDKLRMLSCIFEYIFQHHSDVEDDEIEKILSTKNLILFRLFIESCTLDDNETNFFFQDIINSHNFHKDKVDFILTKYGGLLSPKIFSVFIENSYEDYGNERTHEYLMNMFRNEIQNLTDEQLEIIYSEGDHEIKEIVSDSM